MSLSFITLSGTLRKDPEKRFTPTNIPVTNLLIEVCYVPRGIQQQEGLASQVIRVNAWRDLAEECEKKLKAGDKIVVSGRVQMNAYTNQEGKKKRELEVDATSVKLLNDILAIQPPVKKDEKELVKTTTSSFKKSIQDEEITSVEEMISGSEEIPF